MSSVSTIGAQASFCRKCGQLLVEPEGCPDCDHDQGLREALDTDTFKLSVTISTLRCDACGTYFSVGSTSCPSCSADVGSEELIDAADWPLNRARRLALGDLIPDFDDAADAPDVSDVGIILLTDDQFISFMNRNQLISEHLIGELKELIGQINLSNEEAISSRNTRIAFEAMRDAARRTRRVYDELNTMMVPEQFGRLHHLLTAVYHGMLILYRTCATACLAVTLEELGIAQRDIQAMLDRLALLACEMNEEISRADLERTGTNQVNRRLRAFVGGDADYDYDGLADFAAVLADALREGRNYSQLGDQATRAFRGLALIDPATLPGEEGLFLYMLAAELSASDDPATVRRRASVLLDALRQALHETPQALVSALTAFEAEYEQAIVYWLNERDLLHVLPVDKLQPEAIMQKVTQSYHAMLEGTYRRLTTPFLEAGFILHKSVKPHEEVAVADIRTRINWLEPWTRAGSRKADFRFQSLLTGVSVALRHAVAHGDVATVDTHVVVTQRSGDSVRTIISQDELLCDEMVDCLRDLLVTCQAMRLAYELFHIEFRDRLPAPSLPASARISTEVASCIVGLWDLAHAEVDRVEPAHICVRTQVRHGDQLKEAKEYAVGACTIAALFPQSVTVTLEVSAGISDRRIIIVQSGEVRDYQQRTENGREFWFLRLLFLTHFEPSYESDRERYISGLIQPLARVVVRDLASLSSHRNQLPLSLDSYMSNLRMALRRMSEAGAVIELTDAPYGTRPQKSKVLEALRSIRKGLVLHERYIVEGHWQATRLANSDLERGVRLINQLAAD